MSDTEPLCYLVGIKSNQFSKREITLLEADLFARIYQQLIEVFRQQNKNYFLFKKFTLEKENEMLESNFVRLIIRDILLTEEYSLEGIALYTGTHLDVVEELAAGLNTKPLAIFLRKIIESHKSVRRELYQAIGKKIAAEYSTI